MPETLYAVMMNGDVLTIPDVTAFDIDNTLTIKPGDFYRNKWIEQTSGGTFEEKVATSEKGDAVAASALRDESWTCSFWKFTRGASLPPMWLPWFAVEAVCSAWPDRAVSAGASSTVYVTLRSGVVVPITGVAASTSGVVVNTNKTVHPGDYYRNKYFEQGVTGTLSDVVVTQEEGDAKDGDALNSESWGASHYEFTRTGLLTLFIPWINVMGMCPTVFPNQEA